VLDMGFVGWIVVGFFGGWLSGLVVRDGGARGCLADILIGVLGGLLGGWLSQQLRVGDTQGFIGAVVVAFMGAVIVRLVLRSTSPSPGRRR
jgi:uncharacterized membrane protein YeaQ/YmgE (transglycosylase-associated protein family)